MNKIIKANDKIRLNSSLLKKNSMLKAKQKAENKIINNIFVKSERADKQRVSRKLKRKK
jgi:hypothetical protein